MSVNFHLYNDTINTITDQKLPNNLYLKKLDASGMLIDRCFLEKLFRIIAHCFGFYKNVNVVKELKQQVINQLTPHLELDSDIEEDSFEQFAVKVAVKVKPSPLNAISSSAIIPNQTTDEEQPKKPVLTTEEILSKAAKTGNFSVDASALLFQQETLNITDWPEMRDICVSRYDAQGYLIRTRFEEMTQLLQQCSKLKIVKIDKIDEENESRIHAFVTTLTVTKELAHITVESPLIPLHQNYKNEQYINKYSLTPHTMIDAKTPPAVHYFRKYATTPELRNQLLAISYAKVKAKEYVFALTNICSCLTALSVEHPEETTTLTLKYVFPFLDGTEHSTYLYSPEIENLIKAFPSAIYISLCKQLLKDEAHKKHFFAVFGWLISIKNRPSLMPVIEMAIKTVDRSKLLDILRDSQIEEEIKFYKKEKKLDRIDEERRLKFMDPKAFNTYLENNFPTDTNESIIFFIDKMPFVKIPQVLAYAASKNDRHSSIEQIVAHTPVRCTKNSEVRAIGVLQLIRTPNAENRTRRMKDLLLGVETSDLRLFMKKLAKIASVNDLAEIFSFFHSLALDDTFLTFFRSIIKLDDTSKTVATFISYWNFVTRHANAYHFQRHQPQKSFNQIPSLKTLNAVLNALWSEYSKNEIQQERLKEWLTALLMETTIETSYDRLHYTNTVKPRLNPDLIHLVLERHHWILDYVNNERLYEQITEDPSSKNDAPIKPTSKLFGQFGEDDLENTTKQTNVWDDDSPPSTFKKNCTKWVTELKTHPRITQIMELFPEKQKLPYAIEDVVFDYATFD